MTRRSITRIIQPVPSRQGVHWPQLSCLKNFDSRHTALITSVDWSITITQAVPNDDFSSRMPVEVHDRVSHCAAGMIGHEAPPGMIALRFFQPPRTPPPCFSISSRSGIDIASSTTQGFITCPVSP